MSNFEDRLSAERARRLISLSNSRALYVNSTETLREVGAQSLIVMCYAHWEGFFNFCVDEYILEVNSLDKEIASINPALLACEIDSYLMSLRDKNFKVVHKPDFARKVFQKRNCKKIESNTSILKAASNLDFDRLRVCLNSLEIDESPFLPYRNFIAYQLVRWRHLVAHGSEPELESADLEQHSHTAEALLLLILESFSDKIIQIRERH